MAQISEIVGPNGTIYRPEDWTSAEPLWSTIEVGAGSFPVLSAFSYSYGASVPGSANNRTATIRDTNLQGQGGMLPENETLIVFNIACDVYKIGTELDGNLWPDPDQPDVPLTDMLRLQRDLNVYVKIAAVKNYTQSPLSYWPASQGVVHAYAGGVSRAAGGYPTMVGYNGSQSAMDARQLATPLKVAGGESFTVDFKAATGQVEGLNLAADARMRIVISLDGYRRRPVA